MSGVVWHWTDGNIGIYTKRFDVVNKAMKEGFSVVPVMAEPHIFKANDFK